MRWVEWIEPFGPKSEPVYCRVPESTAIASMQDRARRKGHEYATDEEALTDFMVIHWAIFAER
jgi:hypothetical protein